MVYKGLFVVTEMRLISTTFGHVVACCHLPPQTPTELAETDATVSTRRTAPREATTDTTWLYTRRRQGLGEHPVTELLRSRGVLWQGTAMGKEQGIRSEGTGGSCTLCLIVLLQAFMKQWH